MRRAIGSAQAVVIDFIGGDWVGELPDLAQVPPPPTPMPPYKGLTMPCQSLLRCPAEDTDHSRCFIDIYLVNEKKKIPTPKAFYEKQDRYH